MSKVVFDFTGENFVVTGASSGMGRDVAISLGKAGAKVLAIGRNVERLQLTKAECAENIFTVSVDVCNTEAMENAIKDFVNEHGKLNGCVHAAGVNTFTPLKSYDNSEAERIMSVSFWAGIELVRLVTKLKYGHKGSSSVLYSSVCAKSHEKGMFAYAASKAAINSAVGSIAKEICNKGHRINSILPGWVESSNMTESFDGLIYQDNFKKNHLLNLAKPSDVTGMVLFLLSDRARWITGTNIAVDGGFLA